jgi:hypothetical protein
MDIDHLTMKLGKVSIISDRNRPFLVVKSQLMDRMDKPMAAGTSRAAHDFTTN